MRAARINPHLAMLGLLVSLVVALTGCGATFDPPSGYIQVAQQRRYDLKYVSAAGNVLAAKSRANEDSKADLAFWSAAVERQKTQFDGMTLASRETIRSTSGVEGVLFQFESGAGPSRLQYWVALYVTPTRITTFEAAGSADKLSPDSAAIRAAMLTVR
ncbi:MAG: hypothetical protein JNG88_04810 [Phycisphaerales bacterium]|nr:hypothetical protein [Phycisphaerales bacterium]